MNKEFKITTVVAYVRGSKMREKRLENSEISLKEPVGSDVHNAWDKT